MARPKSTDPRVRQVNLALTQPEYDLLKARADAVGLRLADYARAQVLNRRVAVERAVAALPTLDRLAYAHMARIGANLNQAVRQLHRLGLAAPVDLEPLLRDIRALVARVSADGS